MAYVANVAADQAAEVGRMARMLNGMGADSVGRGPGS
jgi:hypothetical protein